MHLVRRLLAGLLALTAGGPAVASSWGESALETAGGPVSIHADSLEQAWSAFSRAQRVRIALRLGVEEAHLGPFTLDRDQLTARDFAAAVVAAYPDYRFESDPESGLAWLLPRTMPMARVLGEPVAVPAVAGGAVWSGSLYDGALPLLASTGRVTRASASQLFAATFNAPVALPEGTVSARRLLGLALAQTATKSVLVRELPTGQEEIALLNLVDRPAAGVIAGRQAFIAWLAERVGMPEPGGTAFPAQLARAAAAHGDTTVRAAASELIGGDVYVIDQRGFLAEGLSSARLASCLALGRALVRADIATSTEEVATLRALHDAELDPQERWRKSIELAALTHSRDLALTALRVVPETSDDRAWLAWRSEHSVTLRAAAADLARTAQASPRPAIPSTASEQPAAAGIAMSTRVALIASCALLAALLIAYGSALARWRRLLCLALLAMAAHPAVAEVTWDTTERQLAPTLGDAEISTRFAFVNHGPGAIIIESVSASCGCLSAAAPRERYDAGEQGGISATLDLGRKSGVVRQRVIVRWHDEGGTGPSHEQALQVVADVPSTADIATWSSTVLFWDIGNDPQPQDASFTVHASTQIHILGCSVAGDGFRAEIVTLEEGRRYAVRVTPVDTRRQRTAEIHLTTDSPLPRLRAVKLDALVVRVQGGQ